MTTGINDSIKCDWCGGFHPNKCPLVKAVEYHPDGTTKRVEFYAPKDYPQTAFPLITAGMSEGGRG